MHFRSSFSVVLTPLIILQRFRDLQDLRHFAPFQTQESKQISSNLLLLFSELFFVKTSQKLSAIFDHEITTF